MFVAHRCGHGLQIRAIALKRLFYISERSGPKYGDKLKGKVLEGNQILEIPASNQNFNQIQDYIDLAKNKYSIEIRFKPE